MLIEGASVDLEQENRRLQAELQAQTQELRGSRARLVAVDVRVERGRLAIDVADDGCGGASVADGSGLSGLADRIGALDGRVEIDSPLSRPAAPPRLRSGGGTRVHVEIPLSPTPCRRFLRGG